MKRNYLAPLEEFDDEEFDDEVFDDEEFDDDALGEAFDGASGAGVALGLLDEELSDLLSLEVAASLEALSDFDAPPDEPDELLFSARKSVT